MKYKADSGADNIDRWILSFLIGSMGATIASAHMGDYSGK